MLPSPRSRMLFGTLLVLITSACIEWRPIDAARIPASAGTVRIETTSGGRLTLGPVEVRGDSLVQEAASCPEQPHLEREDVRAWCAGIAVALDDVRRAEIGVGDRARSWLVTGVCVLLWVSLMLGLLELSPNQTKQVTAGRPRPRRPGPA